MQKSWNLFKKKKKKILRQYQFIRKYKLYKIQVLQNKLHSAIMHIVGAQSDTIGKIPYQKEIKV